MSQLKNESGLSREPLPNADILNAELLIAGAQERSRKIRYLTVILLLGLIAFGALSVFSVYKQHEKATERLEQLQRSQEQARLALEAQAKLQKEAENSRMASELLARGANKVRQKTLWNEALSDYDKALALVPDDPQALALDGYLRFRMGDSQSGERMLRRAVEVDPTNPWNHYNLALALWANGKRPDAIAEVEQVLKIDPSFRSIIAEDKQFSSFEADRQFQRLIKD